MLKLSLYSVARISPVRHTSGALDFAGELHGRLRGRQRTQTGLLKPSAPNDWLTCPIASTCSEVQSNARRVLLITMRLRRGLRRRAREAEMIENATLICDRCEQPVPFCLKSLTQVLVEFREWQLRSPSL